MNLSNKILLFILNSMFGEIPQAELTRKQRREAMSVYKRSARRYERYVKHVVNKVPPEAMADPKFRELVAECAHDYAGEV